MATSVSWAVLARPRSTRCTRAGGARRSKPCWAARAGSARPSLTWQQLPRELVDHNPAALRTSVPGDAVERLAQSIALLGVLHPLHVRPNPLDSTRYQVVSGELRLAAATLLGLDTLPVV